MKKYFYVALPGDKFTHEFADTECILKGYGGKAYKMNLGSQTFFPKVKPMTLCLMKSLSTFHLNMIKLPYQAEMNVCN